MRTAPGRGFQRSIRRHETQMKHISPCIDVGDIFRHYASKETGCQNRMTQPEFDSGFMQTGPLLL